MFYQKNSNILLENGLTSVINSSAKSRLMGNQPLNSIFGPLGAEQPGMLNVAFEAA